MKEYCIESSIRLFSTLALARNKLKEIYCFAFSLELKPSYELKVLTKELHLVLSRYTAKEEAIAFWVKTNDRPMTYRFYVFMDDGFSGGVSTIGEILNNRLLERISILPRYAQIESYTLYPDEHDLGLFLQDVNSTMSQGCRTSGSIRNQFHRGFNRWRFSDDTVLTFLSLLGLEGGCPSTPHVKARLDRFHRDATEITWYHHKQEKRISLPTSPVPPPTPPVHLSFKILHQFTITLERIEEVRKRNNSQAVKQEIKQGYSIIQSFIDDIMKSRENSLDELETLQNRIDCLFPQNKK